MKLVEINAFHAQPPQRSVAFLPDRFRLEHALRRGHRIVRIPDPHLVKTSGAPLVSVRAAEERQALEAGAANLRKSENRT
jgi:hypothetical protein